MTPSPSPVEASTRPRGCSSRCAGWRRRPPRCRRPASPGRRPPPRRGCRPRRPTTPPTWWSRSTRAARSRSRSRWPRSSTTRPTAARSSAPSSSAGTTPHPPTAPSTWPSPSPSSTEAPAEDGADHDGGGGGPRHRPPTTRAARHPSRGSGSPPWPSPRSRPGWCLLRRRGGARLAGRRRPRHPRPGRVAVTVRRRLAVGLVSLVAVGAGACGGGGPKAATAEAGPGERAEDRSVEAVADDVTPELPTEVRSADGRTVRVDDVSRIVSLWGNITETVFALGLGDNVVGRDVASSFVEAEEVPVVTRAHDVSPESVLSLRPDGRAGRPDHRAARGHHPDPQRRRAGGRRRRGRHHRRHRRPDPPDRPGPRRRRRGAGAGRRGRGRDRVGAGRHPRRRPAPASPSSTCGARPGCTCSPDPARAPTP